MVSTPDLRQSPYVRLRHGAVSIPRGFQRIGDSNHEYDKPRDSGIGTSLGSPGVISHNMLDDDSHSHIGSQGFIDGLEITTLTESRSN